MKEFHVLIIHSYWDVNATQCLPKKSNGTFCLSSLECLGLTGLSCVNNLCLCQNQDVL